MWTSRTSKPARLRLRPPGPSAERRRSCVSWESGFVWSTIWEGSRAPRKAEAPERVLLDVHEAVVEEVLRLLLVGRISGPEAGVELVEGVGARLRDVLLERVEDERVLEVGDDLDLLDPRVADRLRDLGRDPF